MAEIIIQGNVFSYQVSPKPIKSIRLHLTSASSFVISCPRLTPAFVLTGFINAHADWIAKNAARIPSKTVLTDSTPLVILGQSYRLFIAPALRDSVVLNSDDHKIYLYAQTLTDTHLKKLLEGHLRLLASSLITREIKALAARFGFSSGRVSVRNQKSRYGSCSTRGNLSFNWQIIFFPPDKFRHIILHELTHLKIKNHSRKFWDQLTIYDPNCKANNLWLKKEGTKLFLL